MLESSIPVVAMVVARYPVPSEQFVQREVEGLRQRGWCVLVLSATAPKEYNDVWTGVPTPCQTAFWRDVLRSVASNPVVLAKTIISQVQLLGSKGLRLRALRWVLVSVMLRKSICHMRIDMVHAHFATGPANVGLLLAKSVGVPCSISVHAQDFYVDKLSASTLMARAHSVLACSEVLRSDILCALPKYPAPDVVVSHHGIDLEYWKPNNAYPKEDTITFLAVGRLVEKKGFPILVEAIGQLEARYNCRGTFRCEIVGEGPLRIDLLRYVSHLGLDEVVRIVPWLSADELRQRYWRASALVVPSVVAQDGDRDNIPNVLIEAMACGLPCVVSRLPSMRTFEDNGAAFGFDSGDVGGLTGVLRRFIEEPCVRAKYSDAATRFVQRDFDQVQTSTCLDRLLRTIARIA